MDEQEENQDSGRPSYKQLYEDEQQINAQNDEKIAELRTTIEELNSQVSKHKTNSEEWEATAEQNQSEIASLEATIVEKDKLIKDRDNQIRDKELRRFASAYKNQEDEYRKLQDKWFIRSMWATLALVSSILLSIGASVNDWIEGEWYEQPGFYLLNIIFFTIFVYSLKQHSFFGRLGVDYANRKTLAQSYQHVIEDGEDADIKTGFLQEIVKIFASQPDRKKEEITLIEAIIAKIYKPSK